MNDVALLDSIFNTGLLDSFPTFSFQKQTYLPRTDIKEDNSGYTIELDLPGRTKKDISIEIDHNILTIYSKIEDNKKNKKETDQNTTWIVRERNVSSFSRRFSLPDDIENDKISASFKNGILMISIPRSEKTAPRKIAIEAA